MSRSPLHLPSGPSWPVCVTCPHFNPSLAKGWDHCVWLRRLGLGPGQLNTWPIRGGKGTPLGLCVCVWGGCVLGRHQAHSITTRDLEAQHTSYCSSWASEASRQHCLLPATVACSDAIASVYTISITRLTGSPLSPFMAGRVL